MGLLNLLAGLSGGAAPAAVAPDPGATPVDEVVVQAKKKVAPAPDIAMQTPPANTPGTYAPRVDGEGANTKYNNVAAANAIQDVSQHTPFNAHGNGMGLANILGLGNTGGGGTLRNVLGTLGDAFLIQAGHQPLHRQEADRQRIAEAAAGFDTDPQAAASRIAATGAEGSMADATGMYNAAETHDLKSQQQEYNQQYRQDNLDQKKAYQDAITADRDAKATDRARALNGGILARAAQSGDPKKYAAARAIALKRSPQIDPSEYPEDPNDFLSGYGMNANQVARQDNQEASLAQRGQIAGMRNATTQRGQNMAAGNVRAGIAGANARSAQLYEQKLIAKQNAGQPLTTAEQTYWNKTTNVGKGGGAGKLTIPGLTPAGGGAAAAPAKPSFSHTATGPNGQKVGWNGKAWVPIH